MSDERTDQELIDAFISWAAKADMTTTGIAKVAGRSIGWASRLVRGKYHRLQFQTRVRIKSILEGGKP